MAAVNVVDVDAVALDREAESVLRGAPMGGATPDPSAHHGGAESSAEQPDAGWSDITPGLVTLLTFVVFPQWGISAEEQKEVSKAAADVLEQIFPGGMGNKKWAPWIRLGLVSTGVVLARFDPEVGFPPMGPRREKPVGPEPSSGSSSSDAQQAH